MKHFIDSWWLCAYMGKVHLKNARPPLLKMEEAFFCVLNFGGTDKEGDDEN